MGTGISQLYKGTYGSKNSFQFYNVYDKLTASEIIATRVSNLDLREHPRDKSYSAKKQNEIRKKISERKANRKEYKKYMSDKRFAKRRKDGVKQFWNQELERLAAGKSTTRSWSVSQKKSILNNETPKYYGRPLQAHHTYSVSKYPHLANRGEVIYPVTFEEHLYGWHGGNFKTSLPGKAISYERKYDLRRKNNAK